ncbi:MAG TPA: hypothetical protein VEQ15_11080 [Myxococcales bacterium]|nr:hypothetical protein [Myxococcales bacterium]
MDRFPMVPPPIYFTLRSKWLALSPRARAMAICAVVAVAGLCLYAAFRGDSVERAVARGDLHAAKTELKQRQTLDAGARSYDAGRIAEAQGAFRVATSSYLAAMRQGDERGLERLIDMTRAPACPARTAAAAALGNVRDSRGVRALHELRRARFADERGKKRRSSACNSAQAARKALKRARKAKA